MQIALQDCRYSLITDAVVLEERTGKVCGLSKQHLLVLFVFEFVFPARLISPGGRSTPKIG